MRCRRRSTAPGAWRGRDRHGRRCPSRASPCRARSASTRSSCSTRSACRPATWSTAPRSRGRINKVFALSDFEAVGYSLSGDPERPTLDVDLHEKSWGPNILRFDLGLPHRHGHEHRVHDRRRLPARLGQRPRRGDPRLGARRAHHGAGPGPEPAARSSAALVRRAGRDAAALARGRLRGRRVRRPLPVLAWLGLPRRRPGVRQSHGAARRAARGRPVGGARDRHPGPARDFRRGLRWHRAAPHPRHPRSRRAVAGRHAVACDLFPRAWKASVRWRTTTASRRWR